MIVHVSVGMGPLVSHPEEGLYMRTSVRARTLVSVMSRCMHFFVSTFMHAHVVCLCEKVARRGVAWGDARYPWIPPAPPATRSPPSHGARRRKACFAIMMSSAIVEALFSRYGYARSKYRSAMKDGTVANILRTHEIEDIVRDLRVPFSRLHNLRSDALVDRIDWSR